MRSIGYILGGKPSNTDDCIDLSRKETPKSVSLELAISEYVTEAYIMKELMIRYSWNFIGREFVFVQKYGACFAHESESRQKLSIDNANKRLECHLDTIKKLGIEPNPSEIKFDYSSIYK